MLSFQTPEMYSSQSSLSQTVKWLKLSSGKMQSTIKANPPIAVVSQQRSSGSNPVEAWMGFILSLYLYKLVIQIFIVFKMVAPQNVMQIRKIGEGSDEKVQE